MIGRRRGLAVSALAALLVGLAAAPPAWAYWSDSGVVTGGTISVGTMQPVAALTCVPSAPEWTQPQHVTWSAPAGVLVTGYEVTVTATAGSPIALDWDTGTNHVQAGTTTLPASQHEVVWGISILAVASREFAGTVTITTLGPNGWRSTARTVDWVIHYNNPLFPGGGFNTCAVRATG